MESDLPGAPTPPTSWAQRHGHKLIAVLGWLLLLGGYFWYAWRNDLGPGEAVTNLIRILQSDIGPLIYLAVYLLRPFVLFPATLLTVAGGFVFGPVWGVIYAIAASNASALLAYLIGRYFGTGVEAEARSLQRYLERLRQHSFETILTLRLVFFPYDLVNYAAGFLRIKLRPFLLATALGSLPGTLAFTLFGASASTNGQPFSGALPDFDPRIFAASLGIFIISIVLSRLFKRREASLDRR